MCDWLLLTQSVFLLIIAVTLCLAAKRLRELWKEIWTELWFLRSSTEPKQR